MATQSERRAAELLAETPIPFSKAGELIPGNPALKTLYRWSLKGINGVILESYRLGGRRFTTKQALARFIDRVSQRGSPAPPASAERRGRDDAISRAERALDEAGIV